MRSDGSGGWLAAARDGDASAWSELYHDVAPIVIGYLRAQRLPDPEDVAGEVFLDVVRGIDRFEGDRRRFRSWVLAIAHHRLLDARRRAQRRPLESGAEGHVPRAVAADDTAEQAVAGLGFGELEPALRTLTDDQRTVLLLRVIGDLSVAEVARTMGRRPGAIKQLQHRAVAALRRALVGVGPDPDPDRPRAAPVRDERTHRDADGVPDASPAGWST